MKFKFINVTINLPDDITAAAASDLEAKVKGFVTDLGLTGTLGFDTMNDIGATTDTAKATKTA